MARDYDYVLAPMAVSMAERRAEEREDLMPVYRPDVDAVTMAAFGDNAGGLAALAGGEAEDHLRENYPSVMEYDAEQFHEIYEEEYSEEDLLTMEDLKEEA